MVENIVVENFPFLIVLSRVSPCLSVPDENRSGSLHENFRYGSKRDLLSRWTHLGTDSSSAWNGSINSRVNARPIRTYLGTAPV